MSVPRQIGASVSGVAQCRLSRPGGSGMRGSWGQLSLCCQCLEKVWHLDLCKVVVPVAVSMSNTGVKAIKGC